MTLAQMFEIARKAALESHKNDDDGNDDAPLHPGPEGSDDEPNEMTLAQLLNDNNDDDDDDS